MFDTLMSLEIVMSFDLLVSSRAFGSHFGCYLTASDVGKLTLCRDTSVDNMDNSLCV